MWAWRVLLRLAFQGTSFRLSDTRTQGRGTPKEVRTTLLPLSRVLLFLLLLSPPQLYLAPRLTQGQRSVPTRCARPWCPCRVHPSNIFAGGRGRIGRSGHTQPQGSAPGWHRDPSWCSPRSQALVAASGAVGTARAAATQWAPLFLPRRGQAGPRALPQWAAPHSCALRQSSAPPPPLRSAG